MSETIDRSLLCHRERQEWLSKHKYSSYGQEALVWVLGPEGKVFGATVLMVRLGQNGIGGGQYDGCLWWPTNECS